MVRWQLLFCFGLLVFLYCLQHACEANSTPTIENTVGQFPFWEKRARYQNMLCRGAISNYDTNVGIMKCILQCQQSMHCHSVYYISGNVTYCYFVNLRLYLTDDCDQVLNAEHYFPRNEPSCHSNDELYRTVQLSDGYFTYKIVDSRTANETTAQQDCATSGANLAILSTIPRIEFFQELMTNCPDFDEDMRYFVGGSLADDVWSWYDGQPMIMNTTFWGENQPNNANRDCVLIKKRYGWVMFDALCRNDYGYVCTL